MEKEKLQNGIKDIQQIKMTSLEKKRVFESVLNSSIETKKTIESPWFKYSFLFTVKRTQLVYLVIIPLIIILSSGGVVFASQDAQPDNILYPIKVNIIEPIQGALLSSPKDKAIHESKLASTRLKEAEKLASNGKLNVANEKQINDLLVIHTKALNDALKQVNIANPNNGGDEIATNFRAEMNAHAKILDTITGDNSNNIEDNNNQTKGHTTKTKSGNQNEKKGGLNISRTARLGANSIREISKTSDINILDKYNKRKESVQALIDQADSSETVTTSSVSTSSDQQKDKNVEDRTNQTLNEAKKYLQEADQINDGGNQNEAYNKLLDSESAIKEAEIFLKAKIELDRKNHNKDIRDN